METDIPEFMVVGVKDQCTHCGAEGAGRKGIAIGLARPEQPMIKFEFGSTEFPVLCHVCVSEADIQLNGYGENLLTVDRDENEVVQTQWDDTEGLLEGLKAVTSIVAVDDGVPESIRLLAGALVSALAGHGEPEHAHEG